jgi:hypothetical protein
MKYLSFVRASEKHQATPPPAALLEAMDTWMEKFKKAGVILDTGGLAPSRDGFIMRVENGKLTTTDGPFSESKEVIGGWAIVEATSKEEIVRLTTELVDLHRKHWAGFDFECEVRKIEMWMGEK